MKKKKLFLLFTVLIWLMQTHAQGVNPQAYYADEDGVEQEVTAIDDGEAPLSVTFRANPYEMDDYTPSYEWHFRRVQQGTEGQRELFVRYEEDTQFTFTESGTYYVMLKTRLEQDGLELDSVTITVSIAESKLEFPNAFSPNGDGKNDTYKAKVYKSIVRFHAIIINRWGQKLYEWSDPAGEWDGKFNGHDVRDGVYFVQVSAKGADGKEYNIRKDVNLLRGYTEGGNSSGSSGQ